MYVLLDEVTMYHYEDDSTGYEHTLGADDVFDRLRERYNGWEGSKCTLGEDGRGSYQGSTGGGCSSVTHQLSIEKLEEFDDIKE